MVQNLHKTRRIRGLLHVRIAKKNNLSSYQKQKTSNHCRLSPELA